MTLHPGPEQSSVNVRKLGGDPIRRALLENNDWYRDLVEHSQDMLCIHDLNGSLLSINQLPAQTLGYSPEELVQIPMRDLVAPESEAQLDEYLSEIMRTGKSSGCVTLKARSGERRIWEYHNTLRTEGVEVPIVLGIAHDVTEQVQTEKLLRELNETLLQEVLEGERHIRDLSLFRSLVNQCNEAIEVVDPATLCILDVNEKSCLELGYSREELLKMRISEIDPVVTEAEIAKLREALQKSGSIQMVSVHRRKDGTRFPVEVSLRLVQLERDYVVTVCRNITQRKGAEERLREYERVVEGLDEMIVVLDRDYRYQIANHAYLTYWNTNKEKVIGRRIEDVVCEEALCRLIKEKMDECFAGKTVSFETKCAQAGLAERNISASFFPIEGPTGVDRIAAIMQDVTESKRVERALVESEERFRVALKHSPIMVFNMDRDLRYTWIYNSPVGETTNSILGKTPCDFFGAEEGERISQRRRKVLELAKGTREVNTAIINGSAHHFDTTIEPLFDASGSVVGLTGASMDITERKQIEEALRRSEESYRLFISQSSEGIFREDMSEPAAVNLPEDLLIEEILQKSYLVECNDAMARMYGVASGQELIERRQLLPAGDPRNIELTREYVRSGFRLFEFKSRESDVHGKPKVFLNSLIGTVKDGKLVRTWGVQRDVTEQMRLEEAHQRADEALRESESHFRLLVEQASDGIFLSDAQGRYSDVNSAGADMLGYSRTEILGLCIADIVAPEEVPRIAVEIARLAGAEVIRTEWTFRRKDGSFFPGEVVCRKLPGGRLQAILRDITERKQAQEALTETVAQLRAVTTELQQAKEKLSQENVYLEQSIDTELGFEEIIGRSGALKEVMKKVATVASSDATVLLLGETGTGKELVARALHRLSRRKDKGFIKVNCAAIPSGLLESELFGHEKGSFTGAVAKKIGRLELADQGTLFLDEIGDIGIDLQPKLLRVLQDQEFERIGSTQTLRVNFRLVAATNRDLVDCVSRREFRSDLYYRLNVFPVTIPSLRERREDIPLLVEHFVRRYSGLMNKSILSIPSKTMELLMQWLWPGNIRELENFMERSVILTPGTILQVPLSELNTAIGEGYGETLRERERQRILDAVRSSNGQLGGANGAAARLGLKRTTLQSKLKNLGIDPADFRA